ncbi:hypothetical protein EST38_g9634 [Candolleomyces aberdarensis]|uniref:Uncharacterized protein n=1 Tax=Candolleomyces aberdarensis TaxID=2316362 RepID=A0A4V1Q2T7_9AGAR|nr:hypothetical protein EST38_g9634 [Candolleomyces aberdarensis]
MAVRFSSLLLLFAHFVSIAFALPVELETRQSVSTLSATEVSAYRPYTDFIPIASGGDGTFVQYWYVGYDPTLDTIIVGYQVGNERFANLVNGRAVMNRINNKNDPVPILPPRLVNLTFTHTEGEIHIVNSDGWVSCPGKENRNSQCTIGYVPSILLSDVGDHDGPYDGVLLGPC